MTAFHFQKNDFSVRVRVTVKIRVRVRVKVRGRVDGNTFKYVFSPTSIQASVLDPRKIQAVTTITTETLQTNNVHAHCTVHM